MNSKRPLFPVRKRPNRISGAVRKPTATASPPPPREPPRRLPSWLARVPRVPDRRGLLIAGAGLTLVGVLLFWFGRQPDTPAPPVMATKAETPAWQGCLHAVSDGTFYPDLLPVPAGEYRLHANAQELKPFLAPHGLSKIQIKEPFLIEKQEVTLKAFRRYVAAVEKMPAGADRDRLKSHIGLHWNKDESETTPVKGVSWEGAWDYADWLGRQTGCAYGLPTREQWGAAALLLDGARESSSKTGILSGEFLKRLLWGVREWSSTPCAGGYYLVGEDDFVPLPEVRSATCMPAMLSVAGFRVALQATTASEPKSGRATPAAPKP
ncbi:MAG: SUMF1/EgtB/PvdO family nonheme iron enzyme [Magnetococcales bacterium]|nr:SUMF1/EgtB/PvdO family nonheme iron enzyme [Magnetococcales bacterium]NGZ06200.1 SUMF1/EgtB/PvdO family nonheme iron enzyme [Magnetococcales bacterium]